MDYKTVLVDGHNLLFRSFYGIPARIPGKDGKPIHGVVGFVGTLLKVANRLKPTHLLVVFDSESGSFRRQKEDGYKKDRIKDWSEFPDEENPFSQLSGIYQALDHMTWKYCEVEGVEADDVIASYAREISSKHEVFIVSTDSDLLQLVNDRVTLFYPRGKASVLYTPEKVREKYGIHPQQIPEFKALVGDKTDNIEGVPGIGPKTAAKLLGQFESVSKLCDCASMVPGNLGIKINKFRDKILRNRALIKLDQELDLPFSINEIKIQRDSWNRKTMSVLREIGLID